MPCDTGMIEAQLATSDLQLELYVDGYEFPDLDTGRDANLLACEIELDLTRRLHLHAAHSQLILHTFELAGFVDQLRALEHADNGQATLGDPDPESGDQFGLSIRLQQGDAMLDGFLTDSDTTRLAFELIDVDRAFISDALAQFAAITDAFPVRGDITAD
ncbi:MAG: WapI family immunity protein, partial [Gaiellaceae bacterium]